VAGRRQCLSALGIWMTTLIFSGLRCHCHPWFKLESIESKTDDLFGIIIERIRLYQPPFQADLAHL
jgi:hypothetical protein